MGEDPGQGQKAIKVEDFVIVCYKTSNKSSHFAGKVVSIDLNGESNCFEINFLTKMPSKNRLFKFVFPQREDTDFVGMEDIVLVLSKPVFGSTKRTSEMLLFEDDLSEYFP